MKPNKNLIIVFLILFYLIVIQRVIILYLFPNTGINNALSQLQQETLPYMVIIKVALLLIALSMILVFFLLKKDLGIDGFPIPKDVFILLILIMSAIIPTVALLNIFLTGDILFSSLLLIYGIVFTTVIYVMEN